MLYRQRKTKTNQANPVAAIVVFVCHGVPRCKQETLQLFQSQLFRARQLRGAGAAQVFLGKILQEFHNPTFIALTQGHVEAEDDI